MKKLFLLPIALFAFACSSDDDAAPVVVNDTYVDTNPELRFIKILGTCHGDLSGTYCITQSKREEIVNYVAAEIAAGNECPLLTFEDIDSVERQGYFLGAGHPNQGCTRQTNP